MSALVSVNAPNPEPFENDAAYRFQDIDAQTPEQYLKESGNQKLPLPNQDRKEIKQRLARKQNSRVSLLEAMVGLTLICLIMGVANFVRFDFYTVGLGLLAVFLLSGLFDALLTARYRKIIIAIFLSAYLLSAAWLVIRIEGWLF